MTFIIPAPGTFPVTRAFTSVGGSVASAAFDRHVLACFAFSRGGATQPALSSVTIAGVAATILVQSGMASGGGFVCSGIAIAAIPAGISGAVSPSYTIAPSTENFALYDIENWVGTSPGTATSSAKPSSLALTTTDNSVVIAVVAALDGVSTDPTASATWTVLTEDFDTSYAAGNAAYITGASETYPAGLSITPTCTHTHTSNFQNACAVVLV